MLFVCITDFCSDGLYPTLKETIGFEKTVYDVMLPYRCKRNDQSTKVRSSICGTSRLSSTLIDVLTSQEDLLRFCIKTYWVGSINNKSN